MPGKADRPKVPKFESEAEEARWWDEHQSMVSASLREAMRDGSAQHGVARRLAGESKNITIRMPLRDIERARLLAEKKGLGYQTYMKMLLHEALEREEERKAG